MHLLLHLLVRLLLNLLRNLLRLLVRRMIPPPHPAAARTLANTPKPLQARQRSSHNPAKYQGPKHAHIAVQTPGSFAT